MTTFVYGQQKVTYFSNTKKSRRGAVGSDARPDAPVTYFLYWFRNTLKAPVYRAPLAHTRVEPITYQDILCYRLVWDPKWPTDTPLPDPPNGPPGPGSRFIAPFRVLVVGRKDYLVREITRGVPTDGKWSVETLTYQFPKKPYPPSTFVFVPPPGAKEKAMRLAE